MRGSWEAWRWARYLNIALDMTNRVRARWNVEDWEMARLLAAPLLVPPAELERQAMQKLTFEALL